MLKRFTAYLLSFTTIIVLLCLQVDLSKRTEEYSARKELRSGEAGLFSLNHLPFSKFDPRSRTPHHIHRTTGNDLDTDVIFLSNREVFALFIAKNKGSFPRYHSAQIARKSKMYILHRMILI